MACGGRKPRLVNGSTVTINAIEAPNKAPQRAQADFYQLVYPIGWQALGLAAPQCNPCDHTGNGIDRTGFHDYVLDSIPSDLGHGEFSPLRHVFLILPDFTGDAAHDAAVSAAYAQALSTTSEAAVDTHHYFLCAVVSANAAPSGYM